MRYFVALPIILLILSSCGSPFSAQESTAPTVSIAPTAIPLSSVDLEPLLIQSGDLPVGVTGAQVRDTASKMFASMPKAAGIISQQFASNNTQSGAVTVFLYDEAEKRDQGYQVVVTGMGQIEAVADLGERGVTTVPSKETAAIGLEFADVLFRRCAAVVHVRLLGHDSAAGAVAYAKRLDKRLARAVC